MNISTAAIKKRGRWFRKVFVLLLITLQKLVGLNYKKVSIGYEYQPSVMENFSSHTSKKNLTQVNEWFHSVLPYVLPRTSVGHDSSRDVNPLRKIWWRNNTVSELRKMELTSSWREKEDSELNNQFTLVGSSCCYLVRARRTFWRRCHFERSKEARNQYLKSCRKLI